LGDNWWGNKKAKQLPDYGDEGKSKASLEHALVQTDLVGVRPGHNT
jgi:hypothetical protein